MTLWLILGLVGCFISKQYFYDDRMQMPLYYCSIIFGCYITYSISYILSQKYSMSNSKAYQILSKTSFGIYLYSDPLNYLIMYLAVNVFSIDLLALEYGAFGIFLCRFIGTVIIAILITEFLRKRKIKYIV